MIFGYMGISTQKEKQTTDCQRITLEQYVADNNFNFINHNIPRFDMKIIISKEPREITFSNEANGEKIFRSYRAK